MNKTLDDYMAMAYRTFVRQDTCGDSPCFVAYNPELEGCMAQGDTWQEAVESLTEARREYIALRMELGWDIPEPARALVQEQRLLLSYRRPDTARTNSPDLVAA